jgi:hypothetical protein
MGTSGPSIGIPALSPAFTASSTSSPTPILPSFVVSPNFPSPARAVTAPIDRHARALKSPSPPSQLSRDPSLAHFGGACRENGRGDRLQSCNDQLLWCQANGSALRSLRGAIERTKLGSNQGRQLRSSHVPVLCHSHVFTNVMIAQSEIS